MNERSVDSVLGVILAGGRARRMGALAGGDKCLMEFGNENGTLLSRAIERATPQCGELILNANGDPSRFSAFNLRVVGDVVEGFAGPLAGILSAMEWTRENHPDIKWVASFASDAPFFPSDLVARLFAALDDKNADLACAASFGRHHPVFGLWPLRLKDDLRAAMVEEGLRKVDQWTSRFSLAVAEFGADRASPGDPFFNVNTPEDLEKARSFAEA